MEAECRSKNTPPPVIAQQYSSASFISSLLHTRKEKFGTCKNFNIPFFYSLKTG
jgi:hypothetical protein